jgi:4-hydroxybenzoyl-CoA thioesterase
MAFLYRQKVLFQHCDPAGIVFYPRYFEMMNAAVEEWFEAQLDHSFARLHGAMQAGVPTAALQVTFSAPSRLGDLLEIALHLRRLGRSSADLEFVSTCGGHLRVRMTSTLVFINLRDGASQPWPEALRARLLGALEPNEAPQAPA